MRTIPLKTAYDLLSQATAIKVGANAVNFSLENNVEDAETFFFSFGYFRFRADMNHVVKIDIDRNEMILVSELGEEIPFTLLIPMHLDSTLGAFDDIDTWKCPHCGSTEGTWFERTMTYDDKGNEVEGMGDVCNNCGERVN